MLNSDYNDILSAFINAEVEFLLVGAYALAAHGLPRATGDIDLWVGHSRQNARKIIQALASFGAPMDDITEEDFTRKERIFQIGVAPRRVDILTSIDGVIFKEAWAKRETIELAGIQLPVISRQHLVQNKRAVGRLQDKADVNWLEGQND